MDKLSHHKHSSFVHRSFLEQGLVLGPVVPFEHWFGSAGPFKGWQEIVFELDVTTKSIAFNSVDVFWGTATQKSILFGSDCRGLDAHLGERCFWTLLLPFCETVLSLTQHMDFVPVIRVDCVSAQRQYLQTYFFELPSFDYLSLTWTLPVDSLATPIAIGA